MPRNGFNGHATPQNGRLVRPRTNGDQSRAELATIPPGGEAAVATLLDLVGEDPAREGLRDTPRRVVHALQEMTSGYREDPAEILARTFAEDHDELVVVHGIEFWSLCEHHLLPFRGELRGGERRREFLQLVQHPRGPTA